MVLLVDLYEVYNLVGGYHFIYATHSTPLHNPHSTEGRGTEKRTRKDKQMIVKPLLLAQRSVPSIISMP